MTQVIDNAGASFGFGYDATNKLTSRSLPNNITSTYEYDGLDRLTRLKHVGSSSTLADYQYQFNTASEITQIAEPTTTRNFAYDTVDRLTSATQTGQPNESYSFDGVGNRTTSHRSASYGYQPFNKLVTTSTAAYVYDNNGNMLRKTDSAGTWQYYWNAENQLVRVVKPGAGPLPYRTINYKYDALGRRVERQMKRGGSIAFTYDGQDVILDQKSDGTTTTYINGPGIDNKLKQTSSVTGTHYYLQDHLGSTTALTDSSGNLSAQLTYDTYGNSAPNSLTRYGYTGRELDADTGLIYYRARWYDTQLGRFISEDPIGFEGGMNLYAYVEDDPLSSIDPLGQDGVGVDRSPHRRKRKGRRAPPPFQPIVEPPPPTAPQPPATPTLTPSEPPNSPASVCGCKAAIPRLPEYYTLSVGVPFPGSGGPFAGLSLSFTIDRNWHGYFSAGPSAGLPGVRGGSITANWILQKCEPTPDQLGGFLTGPSVSGHGFIPYGNPLVGPGGGATWSPGYGGGSLNLGFGSPGVGGGVTGGWELW